jgi:protein-disulfide isomerase
VTLQLPSTRSESVSPARSLPEAAAGPGKITRHSVAIQPVSAYSGAKIELGDVEAAGLRSRRKGAKALIDFKNVFLDRFWPRRALLALVGLATVALFAVSAAGPSFAERRDGPAEVPTEELMKPTDLSDIVLGPADAKVTVIEYGSMTCGHCAHFANDVFAAFKTKFIDTGKIRYIFREFPLDNLAAAVSMLARCAGGDKTFPLIETFYAKQADWAFTQGNPVPKLFDIAKQAGFTQESFDKCLTDQKLLDQITAQRTRASETFGVNATPTFFINGKRLQEAPSLEAFDKVIEPLLAAK